MAAVAGVRAGPASFMRRPPREPASDRRPPRGTRHAFRGKQPEQKKLAPPGKRRVQPLVEVERGSKHVPTRWLKAVAGVLLLPVCWVASRTFFDEFTRAAVAHQFWRSEEFYFFMLGVVLWIIAFFGLPRPLVVYVFGHELTHALWVLAQGGRVSEFKVGREGGYIMADRRDFFVSLAPYFFPLYSIAAIGGFWMAGLFYPVVWQYRIYLFMVIGATWAFHFTFTCWMIPKQQTDLLLHGTFFSLVVIYLANLAVLAVLLVAACPQVTWSGFGQTMVREAADFSGWVCATLGVDPEEWLWRWLG